MNTIIIFATPILVLGFVYLTSMLNVFSGEVESKKDETEVISSPFASSPFLKICDTIYVLNDRFIEVSLEKQKLLLRYRDGHNDTFRISSGNHYIKDGIETPDGIFTVQAKNPLAISKQFDDAKLFFWIGFNGNVGFHGLEGNSYYRFLGKRASSHGCVRMAREEIGDLFKKVWRGIPVVVYKSNPARVLAFADSANFDSDKAEILHSDERANKQQRIFLKKRLEALYHGKYFSEYHAPIYLDGSFVLRPGGWEVGTADSVPYHQDKPLFFDLLRNPMPKDNLARFNANERVILNDSTAIKPNESQ